MNTHSPLPQFARDLLAGVPRQGEGVHRWLFRMARVLHACRSEREIAALLEAAVHDCGRTVRAGEIEDAIRASKACAWVPGQRSSSTRTRTGTTEAPTWPPLDEKRRAAILAEGRTLYDLWEQSPVRFDDDTPHTEEIIDLLFPGNPWLCVGRNQSSFRTRRRADFRGNLSPLSFIVPSPMTARTGRTKEGKISEHALANTGPRRFLIVEFDTGSADDHAALLLHLAERAVLVLAVHSAGKSLHGWFHCPPGAEAVTARFMRYAVSLGADSHLWLRSQFVRMPDGTRDNGQRQAVFFFNPSTKANSPTSPNSPGGY